MSHLRKHSKFKKALATASAFGIALGGALLTSSSAQADDLITSNSSYSLPDGINYLTLSPQGDLLVGGDLINGKLITYTVNPDGSLSNKTEYDVPSDFGGYQPGDFAFNSDGTKLFGTNNSMAEGFIFSFDVSNQQLTNFQIHGDYNNGIDATPQGIDVSKDDVIASSSYRMGSIYTALTTDSSYQSTPLGDINGGPMALSFTHNGDYLIAANPYLSMSPMAEDPFQGISVFSVDNNTAGLTITDSIPRTDNAGAIGISDDDSVFAVGSTDDNYFGYVTLYGLDSNGNTSELDTLSLGQDVYPRGINFSKDGKNIFLSDFDGGQLIVLQINEDNTLSEIERISTDSQPAEMAMTEDGSMLFLSTASGITSYDVAVPEDEEPSNPGEENGTNSDQGTVNVLVNSTITLTLDDQNDSINLIGLPGDSDVNVDDNTMNYTVKTNNLAGYIVTIESDQANLSSVSNSGNSDVIPVDLITVEQSDSQNGTGTSAISLSSEGSVGLYSQDQRSEESGDTFASEFSLTEVPWINADDYTGTVTYTATAK